MELGRLGEIPIPVVELLERVFGDAQDELRMADLIVKEDPFGTMNFAVHVLKVPVGIHYRGARGGKREVAICEFQRNANGPGWNVGTNGQILSKALYGLCK